jgi:hypothetical protein
MAETSTQVPNTKIYALTCPRRCGTRKIDGQLTERRTLYKTGMVLEDVRVACPHCGENMSKKLFASE